MTSSLEGKGSIGLGGGFGAEEKEGELGDLLGLTIAGGGVDWLWWLGKWSELVREVKWGEAVFLFFLFYFGVGEIFVG